MNLPAQISEASLPALVDRAAKTLAGAKSSAEVLEARDMASLAYDQAKLAARFAKAKAAHDDLIQRVYRAQADALDIEAQAKRRLADEYDAAQERGEVTGPSDRHSNSRAEAKKATVSDIGLTHKDVHEARTVRDAEKADPGIVRRVADAEVAAGREPTRTKVRRAVREAAGRVEAKPSRGKDAIMSRVREAITILSGLPPAEQVAGYFQGTDQFHLIDGKLPTAVQWMGEFAEHWSNHDA